MSKVKGSVASRIIGVLAEDISNRGGIGTEFNLMDDEYLQDMFETWKALINAELVK